MSHNRNVSVVILFDNDQRLYFHGFVEVTGMGVGCCRPGAPGPWTNVYYLLAYNKHTELLSYSPFDYQHQP